MKPGDRYGVLLSLGLGNDPRDKQLKRNPLSKNREEFYKDMGSFNRPPQKPANVELPSVQEKNRWQKLEASNKPPQLCN
jgi:hypothetical protein